jgi:alpha-beta hydrolase superfamily lysophospholipase
VYDEVYLVGHSLGGLVIRRALADVAQAWNEERELDKDAPRPRLLDARVRLFSPASAGFQPKGRLALLKALGMWSTVDLVLSQSAAYHDLQPGSQLLESTRKRTEALVKNDKVSFAALRAQIVWANPEHVVATERYDSDPVQASANDTTHLSVCKPHAQYRLPWIFVETGKTS